MTIENVKIRSTMLGIEDHGLTTCWLMLEWPGSGQGFGGRMLGTEKKPHAAFGFFVRRILETLGTDIWENLPGKYARIEHDDGSGCSQKILRLGHITEDRWFDPEAELAELEKTQ